MSGSVSGSYGTIRAVPSPVPEVLWRFVSDRRDMIARLKLSRAGVREMYISTCRTLHNEKNEAFVAHRAWSTRAWRYLLRTSFPVSRPAPPDRISSTTYP